MPPVGQDRVDAFWRDGAVLIEGAVSPDWLDRVADAIERDIETPGPFHHGYVLPNGKRFHGNLRIWENDADFRAYCFDSPLPAMAAEIMGAERVKLFYDQLFVKEPGADQPTRWHNDQPYWPVRGRQVMSFWLALDEVTADSGRLEFVAGSHDWDRLFQPEPFAPGGAPYDRGEDFETMPDIEANRGDYEILAWDMKPGDVIAFHAMTVHYAGGNTRGDRRRRGYTVRYCGDDAVYFDGAGPNAGLKNPALKGGDPIESEQFPLVWTAG
ncbi:MAG: phytanoyl-CoA dioxygenase family protein [Minwuia sp.]|uniref:phytanoyl-CoA dioxygenase family protein n=1 Tax=Minwuia sp. TaxID=2493630 RepID=UPI003A881C2E